MNSKVFKGRRKIQPFEYHPVRVPGWTLDFHLPSMPYFEPGMGCIHPIPKGADEQELHGVAYLVSAADYRHIRKTEGGGYKDTGYQDINVECVRYDGQQFTAKTLVRPENHYHVDSLLPSKRYLTLLRDGAREHGITNEYVDYLESLRHYEPKETVGKQIGRYVLLAIFLPLALPFLLSIFLGMVWKSFHPPRWIYLYFKYIGMAMWKFHDLVLEPALGSGKCNACVCDPVPPRGNVNKK
jgi:hypothetical protein